MAERIQLYRATFEISNGMEWHVVQSAGHPKLVLAVRDALEAGFGPEWMPTGGGYTPDRPADAAQAAVAEMVGTLLWVEEPDDELPPGTVYSA